MRIAHVTATFPPYYAGTGNVCFHNAQAVAQLGHSVTVITAAVPDHGPVRPDGVQVRPLPSRFRVGNAPWLQGLSHAIGDVELIHLHYPFIFGAEMTLLAARRRQLPLVITYHNDLLAGGLRRPLFYLYRQITEQWIVSAAARILVVSRDYARHCTAGALLRRGWERVVEVPNGVDVDLFCPSADGSEVRTRHGIPEDVPVILFVGGMDDAHHFKGVPHLMHAFANLAHPQAYLLLVGAGNRLPGYRRLAAELGIDQRAIFAGPVPHHELPPYYAAADVLVLPSVPPESFGLVLIEAMACGRPVIASDIPGVRTVVDHGQNGLLFRAQDVTALVSALVCVLENPARAHNMGRCGRQKVEATYAWPRIGQQVENIYRSLLEQYDS